MINNKANLEDSSSKKVTKPEKNSKNQDSGNNKAKEYKNSFIKSKKDFSFLTESKYVEKWVLSYSENLRQNRLSLLAGYCKFLDKKPDEIIEEHHKDKTQENLLEITDIGKNQLHAYYKYLTGDKNDLNDKVLEDHISPNSARQYVYSKIASYFKRNNIPIIFQKGEIPKEKDEVRETIWRNGEERISKDQKKECMKQIRENLKLIRDKAILSCKISSGLDDVELFNLKIDKYEKGYYKDFNVCYIEGYRQKVGIKFQTIFNSEACYFIDLYLKERKQKGEKVSKESWLFVSDKIIDGKSRKIKSTAFLYNLKAVCEKLELNNITPKSFRRWFKSELRRNGIEREVIERMMGHKTQVSAKYEEMFKDIDEFVSEYIENIEPITSLGNGTNRQTKEQNVRIEKIENQNKFLIEQLANIQKENKELREIVIQVPKLVEAYETVRKQTSQILSYVSNKDIIKTLGLKESKGKAKKFELDNENEENGDE